jgi:hypothetical protein
MKTCGTHKNIPQHMPVLIHAPRARSSPPRACTHSSHLPCAYLYPPPVGVCPPGLIHTPRWAHLHLRSCVLVLMWAWALSRSFVLTLCVSHLGEVGAEGGVCVLVWAGLGLGCTCLCSHALMCASHLGEVGAGGGVWLKEVVGQT